MTSLVVAASTFAGLGTQVSDLEVTDLIGSVGCALLLALCTYVGLRSHAQSAMIAELEVERDRVASAERARLARELHDIVSHALTVIVLHASGAPSASARDPHAVNDALAAIELTGRQATGELRQLLVEVRGEDPIEGDPHHRRLHELPDLLDVVRRAGVAVELVVEGAPRALHPRVEHVVYRSVQEALTNVCKHAGAGARARVEMRWRDGLVLDILSTSPAPRNLARPNRTRGFGLDGLRERVLAVGGSMQIGAEATDRFRVRICIPTRSLECGQAEPLPAPRPMATGSRPRVPVAVPT